jgi:hypothetical protein
VVCTDDVNLLGENINIIKKNRSKEVCLEVNAEKTKYANVFMSHYQTTGQNYYVK